MMKTITKALAGTVAAGAMAVTSASPVMARHKDRDRIDAGDIIAGALILGGIAAVASATKKDRNRGYRHRDRDYRGYNSRSFGSPRGAVERCIRAAERRAKRAGYRFADVTQIRDVDDTRYGWRVKGRLVVDGARGYRGANNGHRYNDRYRYDDRGYGYNHRAQNRRGADRGKFTCYVGGGQRPEVSFRGIRGL